MSRRAVGYTRLSQESQMSIPEQKRRIRQYCDREGFELLTIHDEGERSSGYDDVEDRPAYQEVKQLLRERAVDAVVVRDRQRIGRDFDERMQFILDCRQTDMDLHTERSGEVDLSDPYDAAMESMHAAADDQAKRAEIEKAKQAIERRLEQGYYHGQPPLGLTFDEDKQHLVPDEEFETVQTVLDRLEDDVPYREISDELGVAIGTISNIKQRGREFYEEYADT